MEKVVKKKNVPAYRQLQEIIKRKIKKENLSPQALLPSEHELVKAHKVSRVTVRQALTGLVNENIIYRINGKGTFVAPRDDKANRISNNAVGVIMPNLKPDDQLDSIHSPAHFSTLMGAHNIFNKNKYDMTLFARQSDMLNREILKESDFAGYLVLYTSRDAKQLIIDLKACDKPFVMVNTPLIVPGINRADFNMYEAGRKAVEHLADNGRKKIFLVCADNKNAGRDWFYEGMRKMLDNYGLEAGRIKLKMNFDGYLALDNFIKAVDKIDAVVTVNDVLAARIINKVLDMNLKVPKDVSVIGYGNGEVAEKVSPSLTTFRLPCEILGKEAAQLLLKHINIPGNRTETVNVAPELIVRESG